MPFYNFPEIEFRQKHAGMFGKIINGEKMQMAYIHLDFGIETNHSHQNEQMGYILSGKAEIIIDKNKKTCEAGEAYLIPSNIQHGFKVLSRDGVDYIEIFSPPKEENKDLNKETES